MWSCPHMCIFPLACFRDAADKNGDNQLSLPEIEKVLQMLNSNLTKKDVRKKFNGTLRRVLFAS